MKSLRILTLSLAVVTICPVPSRAGGGAVALETADPACPDDSGDTYVDCLNGTVTDNRTGLVWLKDAGCLGAMDWFTAMETVAGLSDLPDTSIAAGDDCALTDGSSPGEWRLPSVSEWQQMEEHARDLLCQPTITDDAGTGCWSTGCSNQGLCAFARVQLDHYWSSTSRPDAETAFLDLNSTEPDSGFRTQAKSGLYLVWPVRGGQ